MENQIKFTDEELNDIKSMREDNTSLILEFGQIEVDTCTLNARLKELEVEKQNLQTKYFELQQRERNLVQVLNEKYGAGTVDIESGVFIPNK
jgi:hypothetical protein